MVQVDVAELLDLQAYSETRVRCLVFEARRASYASCCPGFVLVCAQVRPTDLGSEGAPHAHDHSPQVSSVSVSAHRDVDLDRFKAWVKGLISTDWRDLYRVKGILSVRGSPRRFVAQGTHADFAAEFTDEWGAGESRVSRMVFIGRKLDRQALETGFNACLCDDVNGAAGGSSSSDDSESDGESGHGTSGTTPRSNTSTVVRRRRTPANRRLKAET